jgi:hypothetical protein
VVDDLVQAVARHIGWVEVITRLGDLPPEHELREYLHLSGTEVRLERQGIRALPLLLEVLAHDLPVGVRGLLKSGILAICTRQGLPLPPLGVGVEEIGAAAIT